MFVWCVVAPLFQVTMWLSISSLNISMFNNPATFYMCMFQVKSQQFSGLHWLLTVIFVFRSLFCHKPSSFTFCQCLWIWYDIYVCTFVMFVYNQCVLSWYQSCDFGFQTNKNCLLTYLLTYLLYGLFIVHYIHDIGSLIVKDRTVTYIWLHPRHCWLFSCNYFIGSHITSP